MGMGKAQSWAKKFFSEFKEKPKKILYGEVVDLEKLSNFAEDTKPRSRTVKVVKH